MTFALTETFDDDCFEYEGLVFHIDMAFDNILRLFEMFADDDFHGWEKILLALQILLYEYDELKGYPFEAQNAVFQYVMKEFLEIDLNKPQEKQKKFMDFQKDAELIYASFFAVYKMDLFQLHGKLHWKKFRALLTQLDDESKFKQAVGYRTMKVPSGKGVTQEQIDQIQKMKRAYALEQSEEEQEENIKNTFDTLASAFKKGGDG
jgi:hypothetical protein